MDNECQHIAEEIIHSHFPNHAILGEEGSIANDHPIEWIIDPIDGTANYTRNLPFWCCSVAVRCDNEILAGCVFVPVLGDCYSAAIDGPALCNGGSVHTSNIPNLREATFFSGLTKDIDPRAIAFLSDITPRVNKLRIMGSAAIDVCHVACGRSDAYFEPGLYFWDIAAAGLIAQRAGALCSTWPRKEKHGIRYLCSNPHIHHETRKLVELHFKPEL
jgi:myo-inositol-1(or 4)-monophosphatase